MARELGTEGAMDGGDSGAGVGQLGAADWAGRPGGLRRGRGAAKMGWEEKKQLLEQLLALADREGRSKASTSSHSHSISDSLQFPPPPFAKTRGAGVRVSSSGAGVLRRPNLNGRYEITKAWIEADLE
mmetsp:Transcript_28293/g.67337  ORF Transcript_28293/g.67337 Transcript_28293/m.67337 type:complete len:128 (+) Transcript_28293:94-477(+)